MKNKGVIQIPLSLVFIITGTLVFAGVGYFSVKQYQASQFEKTEKEKTAQEQIQQQLKALNSAQTEIEQLKKENQATQEKQKQLEQKVNTGKQVDSGAITSTEIAPYLSAVVKLSCTSRTKEVTGSGTLWKYNGVLGALTNDHVPLGDAMFCTAAWAFDSARGEIRGDHFLFYPLPDYDWNKKTDARFVELSGPTSGGGFPLANMNYGLYNLRHCSTKMPIGSSVMVIGYPASTQTDTTYPRTITNGIISGYDQSVQPPQGTLPYVNYFVSNKIDSGNSGGIAVSKDSAGLCVLGIPTWVQVGHYETEGLVQNILNVLHKE